MTLTINTDASYHPYFKVGAFAFWIVCEQGRLIQSGGLKKVKSAHDAELQCIGNALYAVFKSKFTDVKYVVVNTDCKYAINAITTGKNMGGCSDVVKVIHKIIRQLKKKHNKIHGKKYISWRHVPAHSDGDTKREWVNNRMDSMAKKALGELIRSKKENK